MALRTNGRRNGLSTTVLTAYSYLQYYDRQGAFNSPDTWTDNRINAHTNLTEISNVMDLMWRSGVLPSKVVMRLAFYLRTFMASDRKCVSKGCLFDSAGELGGCSGEIGLVSNAEIASLMASPKSKSTLDKEAAVQWSPTKINGSPTMIRPRLSSKLTLLCQCMGGVMVRAVDHDTKNGTFFKSLKTVTGSEKQSNRTSQEWQHVRRRDPYYTTAGERIWGDTGCQDQSRRFCCPPGPEPWCQWLFHNRGNWNPECLSTSGVEVGSTSTACGNGLSQLACCQTDSKEDGKPVDGMMIWNHCRWKGKEPNCGLQGSEEDACSEMGEGMHPLISASRGSGSTQCYHKWVTRTTATHPTEEQTIPNFFEWLANGQLPAVDASSQDPRLNQAAVNVLAPNGLGREIVTDYLDTNFTSVWGLMAVIGTDRWKTICNNISTRYIALAGTLFHYHYGRMVDRTRAHLEDEIDRLNVLWNDRAVELLGSYLNQGTAGDSTGEI
ncbi:hypothetical protein B0J13DRAFT_528511 [Dactylonectria estremocensis]|uniref:Uncharacterized protein n=1 Tax=Dactylonectria estremocensis TaxID=1079267 RepID=A0A9P9EEV4_9HYPO|nr:hypothetical protein B0J13DRAFT_528511 [Dactylonectria estremocensis]